MSTDLISSIVICIAEAMTQQAWLLQIKVLRLATVACGNTALFQCCRFFRCFKLGKCCYFCYIYKGRDEGSLVRLMSSLRGISKVTCCQYSLLSLSIRPKDYLRTISISLHRDRELCYHSKMPFFNGMFLLFLLAATRPTFAQVDTSKVWSGKYQIIKCNAGQPDSMASKLQAILPEIWSNLQDIATDAAKGTSSSHGYSAFFKTGDNIQLVQAVYQNMAAGEPVSVAAHSTSQGRNINPLNLAWPGLVCIQPGDPATVEHYLACTTGPLAGHMTAGLAGQFIMLCPSFWLLPDEPNISNCPRVRRNTLTPNDDSLVLNRQTQLVHELAHLYGVGGGGESRGLNWREGEHEPYLLQDVVHLSPKDSLKNAQNFAFYYAGKSFFPLTTMKYQPISTLTLTPMLANTAGCTRWPKMAQPHDENRRLLEYTSPNNNSAAASSLPIAPNPAATWVVDFIEPTNVVMPPALDILGGNCEGAVQAPNNTVCCDVSSGFWIPAPVVRDGATASSVNPACPTSTGVGSGGVGAGSGVINDRSWRHMRMT